MDSGHSIIFMPAIFFPFLYLERLVPELQRDGMQAVAELHTHHWAGQKGLD